MDDLSLPGMIHGATVRSPVARGSVRALRFDDPSIPWKEFTIVTARDIPGKNVVTLIEHDQPLLADGVVNHPEEPLALIAHEDKYLLERARAAVKVEIDELPGLFSIEEAEAKRHVIWGEDNVFKSFQIERGDVGKAFAAPGVRIVEGEYRTGAQEQLYIEPNGMIAQWSEADGLTVWGSLQCPYYVHKALTPMFNLPDEKVRVVQLETGGGFGGKEEYPSMLAGHAALLARKSGRPVKMIYDRAEDMVATTKRHPSRTRHRTAVTADGKILGMDIEFLLDGGAYATLSAVVLSRGTIHASGPYDVPNVRIRSAALATNHPPHGAFRGFGAPQSIFALEKHLDRVAAAVGLEPEELRRRNFLKHGGVTATGQVLKEEPGLNALMERAMKESGWAEKRERFARENPEARVKRGLGLATFMHGAGFTGSGERNLASVVGIEGLADGRVRVLAASTEIGQGTNTIFSQVAADALGVDFMDVEVARPDTKFVPNSGPTVASRTVMIVGKLVETAALSLKQVLLDAGYEVGDVREAVRRYIAERGPLKVYSQYKQPPGVFWDDKLYRGEAYATYAWACYLAEVSVDTATYEARVEDFVAVQDVGKVVHPVLAAGQIEGGVAQGIGYALCEEVVWKQGRMMNGRMTNYIMPTAADAPPIRVFFAEHPTPHGPQGAKGIGELPLDGVAPAVLNAVEDALRDLGGGLKFSSIPLLPERVYETFVKGGLA
ncbi:MAG: xanthine dehydrogenase family protein [Bdellovibrionales bacterium]|nr:xanthine dehydrogenase family protein [Bdellovibrionales bacterium]